MIQRWIQINDQKSLLLIGPRRSGKTTLLKRRFPQIAYATLDDFDYLNFAKKDPKGFIENLGQTAIIDEIQREPKLTIAIKYAIDNQNGHYWLTGSSTVGLLDSASDTLAGRVNIQSFPTLCWGEQYELPQHDILNEKALYKTLKQAQRNLETVLTFGGFPEIATQDSNEAKRDLLHNYKSTYFLRDIMQLSSLENTEGLMALYTHLINSVGSHVDISRFSSETGLSAPTVKKYLNSLSQSQLIFKLYGYQYGPAKRYIKAPKTYFADNGIMQSFTNRISKGQLIENFVISELEKRRKLGFIQSDQFYFYKSSNGTEVDLVFETPDHVFAIEIKSTSSPTPKDIHALRLFDIPTTKTLRKILFYSGEEYKTVHSIEFIPIAALFLGK